MAPFEEASQGGAGTQPSAHVANLAAFIGSDACECSSASSVKGDTQAGIPREQARLQPHLQGFEPYDPGFSACAINLSANENTYPVPQEVAEAQQAALASFLAGGKAARYPDPCAHALRAQLAARLGVPEGNVLVTNGGDEALYLMCLAFGGPGRTLVDVPPSFSVYSLYARMSGTRVVEVPRDPATWAINWPALEAAAQTANLVVVTSPNNPTGDVAPREELLHLVEHSPALVLVDEAYLEFSEGTTSLARKACQRENLVVLRTLSKAFGLAGARLGYLVAPTYVIEALQALRQPYSVNALSQVLAAATLEHAPAFEPYLTTVRRERNQLVAALNQLPGVRAWPSEANFVLVQLPHALTVRERLRTQHCILVRDFSTAPATPECLRITVGTPAECAATLAALTQILANPTPPKEAQ